MLRMVQGFARILQSATLHEPGTTAEAICCVKKACRSSANNANAPQCFEYSRERDQNAENDRKTVAVW